MDSRGADGAFFLARLKRRLAIRTNRFCRMADGMSGNKISKLLFELVTKRSAAVF